MDPAEVFAQYRPMLLGIAYRMLGSVMDAEDVVQEAYLRWERAARDEVDTPRAFLSTIVTRLSIDTLRKARRRREVYTGEWLPEPLITGPEPMASAELAESLSTAFMVMLESLSPPERAAFLLREVFAYEYRDVAEILGKSESNCRQMVKRARDRLVAREHRFEPSAADQAKLLTQFVAATQSGDYETLVGTLAKEATLYSDHGGKVAAAQRAIRGADKVARFFLGVQRRFPPVAAEARFVSLNGRPGIVVFSEGRPHTALTFEWEAGRAVAIYAVRNPEKLQHLAGIAGPVDGDSAPY